MVAVHALRATDIAVGVVHLTFPLLAVGIGATTNTALRLLNGDVERAYLHMAILVVACFFLRFVGVGIYFG